MIDVRLKGLKGVVDAIRDIPTAIGRETLFETAVEGLTAVLAEKTPPGWSRNLRRSAMSESVLVGYSAGVEEAGDEFRKNRRRLDDRRWVSVEELETVLLEAVTEYRGSVIGLVSDEVDSVLP